MTITKPFHSTIRKSTVNMVRLSILMYLWPLLVHGVPINLVSLGADNTGNLDFNLQMPNKDIVQVGIFFKLLTVTAENNGTITTEPTTETSLGDDGEIHLTTTTAATTTEPEKKYVTVTEAIEGFRQNLIKQEMDIAGVIESEHIFYRHFKLEFDDDKSLAIRCTYDSNYRARALQITCYEYHEFEAERILSNGEVEYIRQHDPDYKTDIEFINLRGMKQTYEMVIH